MATRRYTVQPPRIQSDLQSTLRKMRATGLKVTQDFETGECEIRFDRSGQRYVVRCKKWAHPTDNFRAAQRAISLVYQAIEEAGVISTEQKLTETFGQFFAGWAAPSNDDVLALPSGNREWWEILGIRRESTAAEVRNAYLALAFVHHPDAGGSAEDFKRVRAAYEAGLKAVGG
jgi:hypothetical protein